MTVTKAGHLSSRGAVLADPSNRPVMLDIVSNLWHPESNPGGYLSLGVAENTLMHDEITQYMTKNISLNSHALTYGDSFSGSHGLKSAISAFITRHFSPLQPVLSRHIVITSGVGPAIDSCVFSLCDPGDGILLGRPYYGAFPSDVSLRAKAQIIPVAFDDIDPFSLDAMPYYEKALSDARERGILTKAMILCNPHNPLGRCFPPEVLAAYMQFCQKHNIHLISDEIYALSIWENPDAPDAPPFTSTLSIDTAGRIDPSLVHVLWGMSKDFGSNGIRLGCIVSQNNNPLIRALEANSYFTCPSSLADRATTALLSDTTFVESFIRTNSRLLTERYVSTVRFLESRGIPYQEGSNAGLFVWVDLLAYLAGADSSEGLGSEEDRWALETRLEAALLKERVFLACGAAFGSYRPGWFRVVFAHDEAYLLEGLRRIVDALELLRGEMARG
ncbi:1-aminocyclopropane-1-carboxylate synthase C [Sodiomyces alkalinus F11]|uniref:1-aminocyclopropane-1-carboxylate synthase C n=1 Tax=Sodiomyces alkalinus (strain CBS 110278 / VKM F-3762 / F11) TaxID=1314773 RepID=A0A3N2PKR8_SODAK|nr:1-aminocyclopropane-1-carboxylate synthase C [Sodiomyces alkalinus F11]ROT35117.1 1-aminocyclopropane-1-carboxylate synthase C [Sodiomyces alkalinus F11]